MVKKAKSYALSIMSTTRDHLDRSLVARSLWNQAAMPAILYATEACVISKKTLEELKSCREV